MMLSIIPTTISPSRSGTRLSHGAWHCGNRLCTRCVRVLIILCHVICVSIHLLSVCLSFRLMSPLVQRLLPGVTPSQWVFIRVWLNKHTWSLMKLLKLVWGVVQAKTSVLIEGKENRNRKRNTEL